MGMSLRDPDTRRALRSIVQAIVALVVIGLVGWIIDSLRGHPKELYGIAVGSLIIVGLGTLLYGAENVTRAVRFKGPFGIEGGIGDEAARAAEQVAAAAVDTASAIKEDAKP